MQLKYFKNHPLHKSNDFTKFPPIQNYIKTKYDEGRDYNFICYFYLNIYLIRIRPHNFDKNAKIINGERNNPCDEQKIESNMNFLPPKTKPNETFVLYYHQVRLCRSSVERSLF